MAEVATVLVHKVHVWGEKKGPFNTPIRTELAFCCNEVKGRVKVILLVGTLLCVSLKDKVVDQM